MAKNLSEEKTEIPTTLTRTTVPVTMATTMTQMTSHVEFPQSQEVRAQITTIPQDELDRLLAYLTACLPIGHDPVESYGNIPNIDELIDNPETQPELYHRERETTPSHPSKSKITIEDIEQAVIATMAMEQRTRPVPQSSSTSHTRSTHPVTSLAARRQRRTTRVEPYPHVSSNLPAEAYGRQSPVFSHQSDLRDVPSEPYGRLSRGGITFSGGPVTPHQSQRSPRRDEASHAESLASFIEESILQSQMSPVRGDTSLNSDQLSLDRSQMSPAGCQIMPTESHFTKSPQSANRSQMSPGGTQIIPTESHLSILGIDTSLDATQTSLSLSQTSLTGSHISDSSSEMSPVQHQPVGYVESQSQMSPAGSQLSPLGIEILIPGSQISGTVIPTPFETHMPFSEGPASSPGSQMSHINVPAGPVSPADSQLSLAESLESLIEGHTSPVGSHLSPTGSQMSFDGQISLAGSVMPLARSQMSLVGNQMSQSQMSQSQMPVSGSLLTYASQMPLLGSQMSQSQMPSSGSQMSQSQMSLLGSQMSQSQMPSSGSQMSTTGGHVPIDRSLMSVPRCQMSTIQMPAARSHMSPPRSQMSLASQMSLSGGQVITGSGPSTSTSGGSWAHILYERVEDPDVGFAHYPGPSFSPRSGSFPDAPYMGDMRQEPGATSQEGQPRLWKFMLDLLEDPRYNPSLITWVSRAEGIFRLIDPPRLAEFWGHVKGNRSMNYEKLSRGLRYYYNHNVLEHVPGKLVYKFGPEAQVWPYLTQSPQPFPQSGATSMVTSQYPPPHTPY